MFGEIFTGVIKLAWAWIPFLVVMIGGAIYEHRHNEVD